MKKKCPRCKKILPLEKFSFRKTATGRRAVYCRPCQAKYHKEHYARNKQLYIDREAARKRKRVEELGRLKSQPCKDCRRSFHPCVMDFDHVSGDKIGNVSYLIRTASSEKVVAEIRKCDVVCANCHRLRTWKRVHPLDGVEGLEPP